MPRMQTPKGFITATRAKEILNLSDAMIRMHVQKGKIKYLLPEGRKQGFYSEKDVIKLANELNIFLTLDEEAPGKFTRASKEDIEQIMEIGKATFGSRGNETRTTPLKKRMSWMKKNPDIYYVIKVEDEVVGYTYTLPLKQGTDKIEKLLRSDFAGEVDITADDIEEFKPGRHIELYIVAIAMKPSIKYPKRRVYASRLISNLMHTIIELGREGVIIETITAIGYSPEGRRLLQNSGFSEIPSLAPGKRAFRIKIEESGAPLIAQYKQALQESKNNIPSA